MGITSRSLLQSAALRSGLVTAAQIERALDAVRALHNIPSFLNVSDEELSEQMVFMKMLTPYQAEQLKAGRAKLTLGPYVITDWIAQGGMGQVFKAEHKLMGREVAIKVLPYHRSTPEAIENFTLEIRTQAKLDHENLVRAYDAGHDGKVYFLVTEFVPGTDLRRLLRTEGPLRAQHAASIITQAAKGLQAAHDLGLIHRDVKPGNILVTPDGRAKVSDLGLAGFLDGDESDPRAGKIVGTADYISPEQIMSPRDITPASDIYSLGCTLYYAVTGKVPFPGGSTREKTRRHCEETPWHPRRFQPALSEEFVEVIADMMEKEPAKRISSASEVVARLEPWAEHLSPLTTRPMHRSPWMVPPLPANDADEEDSVELPSTNEGSIFEEPARELRPGSSSNLHSQQTRSRAADSEDTHREPPLIPIQDDDYLQSMQPLFPPPDSRSTTNVILLSLVIAIPVSMAFGALLALLFVISWLR